ncbi:hypothetical protein [Ancylobacter polymorphus]|uniref:hypothetical protein n=1 Tax=Ancylobacter polymorphus TaxID=223390 RepID=UPI003521C657
MPYFRKVEAFEGPAGETRGRGGALAITEVGLRPPLADAFIAAAQQAGYGLNRDYNDRHQEGFGHIRRPSAVAAACRPRPPISIRHGAGAISQSSPTRMC